jgi:hypothetical protein
MVVVIAASYQFFLPETRRVESRKRMTIPTLPTAPDRLNDHVRHVTFTLVSFEGGCDNRLGS